jgi:diguanylate cyclase (GGDEF)-like protein/PAS domain S-box-containing protein
MDLTQRKAPKAGRPQTRPPGVYFGEPLFVELANGVDLDDIFGEIAVTSPDLVAIFASTARDMLWCNDALGSQVGFDVDAPRQLIDLLDDRSQGRFVAKILAELLKRGHWRGRLTLLTASGDPLDVSASLLTHYDATGAIVACSLVARPLRERAVDRQSASTEPAFAALLTNAEELFFVVLPQGTIRFASPAAARLLGRRADQLRGKDLATLLHPDDRPPDLIERAAALPGVDPQPIALRLGAGDGSWQPIEATVADLTADPSIRGYVVTARTISEQPDAFERLRALTATDVATGLLSRRMLVDRVEHLLHGGSDAAAAMLLVDLDHFRELNELFGQSAGDAYLLETARRLSAGTGPDALVARLRSDEFAVALPGVRDLAVAERAADALRVLIARPFEHQDSTLRVTASVGVAVGEGRCDVENLLHRADRSAQRAKWSGGNRIQVWGNDESARESRRRHAQRRLLHTVERREVPLHFQPIVDLVSGAVVGGEVFLRVRDGEGGTLEPAELVEAAEHAGLMSEIGAAVLHAACSHLSGWSVQLGNRAPQHLTVNLSPRELVDPGLASQVLHALTDSGIEPGRLWLDISPGQTRGDAAEVAARIQFLRQMGARVGLDDFGAGRTTLDQLTRLPLDYVKISRSLVNEVHADERVAAIVRATVNMSHALDLIVAAVGVETAEQLEVLRDLGCDLAQGFLFSPTVSPEAFADRLSRGPDSPPTAED